MRAGERKGAPGEPPSLVGAEVRVERGELVVTRSKAGGGAAVTRWPTRTLIAFDMPPAKTPEEGLASLRVPDGFRVELVGGGAEDVIDPIAFDWGADGKFWVVEMRDYPRDSTAKGSRAAW